jgi:7,8-dihydroneopterin aldolase/epimerase/oxygenase
MTIRIDALAFEAVIGILDFERTRAQRVEIDAVIEYDYRGDYLDYAAVADLIKRVVTEGAFGLIEEALETLHIRLMESFPLIETLTLTISKPDILPDCRVSLSETTHRNTPLN